MKPSILAALLLCFPLTLRSYEPEPVLPISPEGVSSGFLIEGTYFITDKSGEEHSGTVLGDSFLSITIPFDDGSIIIRSGDQIIVPSGD